MRRYFPVLKFQKNLFYVLGIKNYKPSEVSLKKFIFSKASRNHRNELVDIHIVTL